MLTRTLFRHHLHRPKIRSFSNPLPQIPSQSTTTPSPNHRHRCLVSILQIHGFPQPHLHDLLSHHHFPRITTPSDLQESLKILSLIGLPCQSLVSLVSSSPRVLELGFLRKWQVGFFRLGFSTAPMLIQRVLEHSSRSMVDPDHIQRNLLTLREIGFSHETLIRVLEEVPGVMMDIERVVDKTRILESFGFRSTQIDRICRLFPRFLLFGVENRMMPLFGEFGELGFREEMRKVIVESPSLVLGMEVGELSRCIELLNSLKCRLPVKERVLAKGHVRAALAVKNRVDCMCRHGLIRRDALIVVRREPRLILYELDEIEEKIEFLCHKMGFTIDWLVEVPEFLGVNLEKQIIPRHQVIEFLRSRGALDLEVDPRQLVKFSRKRFYNMFVKPYPECEEIFGGMVRDAEVKVRHPSGLWKLFKPMMHPVSAEDVRNTKSFMES